ncbi:MAG: ABC transporter permease [Euzebya sp.]
MNFFSYVYERLDDLLPLGVEHITVVGVSISISTIIGVTIGLASYRNARFRSLALSITGVFLTIPSFALFGVMISILGLGFKPTVVALVMYGLLPIVRNTVTGLGEVDTAIVESAKGMGLSAGQRLRSIELPLAWPVILTGVRVSTQLQVGVAAIAVIVRGPGLGAPIFAGLGRIGGANATNQILSGIVGVILVALVFDLFYNLLFRLTTTRGIR